MCCTFLGDRYLANPMVLCCEQYFQTAISRVLSRTWQRLWEKAVIERRIVSLISEAVLLADIIPVILFHFKKLSKENIIFTYWVKGQEVPRTFSRSLSWFRTTGSGWLVFLEDFLGGPDFNLQLSACLFNAFLFVNVFEEQWGQILSISLPGNWSTERRRLRWW